MKILGLVACFVVSISALAQEPPAALPEAGSSVATPKPDVPVSAATPAPTTTAPETSGAAVAPTATTPAIGAAAANAPAMVTESSLVEMIKPFIYEQGSDPRDPFRLPEAASVALVGGDSFGPFLPIQEVNLDQVEIKGILLDPTTPKAILSFKLDDKEVTRTLKVGDFFGEHFGKIQAIREGQVIIVQTLEENGGWRTTTRVLSRRK